MKPDREVRGSIDGRLEQAKDAALGSHHSHPSTADEVGEAAGGISGVLLGAGIGSSAGPLGTLLGGLAGAIGGWWAGRAVSEAAERLTEDDDSYYRHHFEHSPSRPADRRYEDVRAAYYLGQVAAHNPNFTERFEDVEPELEQGWMPYTGEYGHWDAVRAFAREGYTHGRERRSQERLRQQLEPTRPDDRRS
jgi:hypothetical protein